MLMISFILEVLGCWRKLPRIFKAIGYDFDSDDYHRFYVIDILKSDQAHVAKVLSSSSFEALIIPLITKTSMLVMKLEFGYTPKSQILDIIEHPCPSNPV
ncbi:hypothetical protein Peur_025291 [Populus x canadensis]